MNKVLTKEGIDLKLAVENLSSIMQAIESWFPGCKATLLLRHKTSYESSLMLTKDSPNETIKAIRYLAKKAGIKDKK